MREKNWGGGVGFLLLVILRILNLRNEDFLCGDDNDDVVGDGDDNNVEDDQNKDNQNKDNHNKN